MEDDNLAEYRTFCANRMRRLERWKKAKSFCSLEDEMNDFRMPSGSSCDSETGSPPIREHRTVNRYFSCPKPSLQAVSSARQPKVEQLSARKSELSENITAPNKFELLRQNLVSFLFGFYLKFSALLAILDAFKLCSLLAEIISKTLHLLTFVFLLSCCNFNSVSFMQIFNFLSVYHSKAHC